MKKISDFLLKINFAPRIGFVEYFILFVTIFFTFYFGFAGYAIENMNEGLYAEIAREMFISGNYIIPHLNFVPYLEKPPLLYWLITLSYHFFGVTVFAARLVPVSAAALLCLGILLFAKQLDKVKSGWLASMILATSIGFIIIARVIIFDMVLTALFSFSLLAFYLWVAKEKRFYLWFAYACLGFAFLTKGILSILLIGFIALLFLILTKTPWKTLIKLFDPIGLGIFLLITLPWIITATLQQPHFIWDYFINEQVLRFFNMRVPHDYHTGPWYFYILPLLGILLPWTVLLPTLFQKNNSDLATQRLEKFLWIWFVIPLIFFSLSQAKAAYYIVISIPAVALLLGLKIEAFIKKNNNKILFFHFIAFCAFYILLFVFLFFIIHNPGFAKLFPYSFIFKKIISYHLLLFFLALILLILGAGYYLRNIAIVQFVLIASLISPWVLFYVADKKLAQPLRSEIFISQSILAQTSPPPLYLYQDYEKFSSILFYVKKRAIIIDSHSKDLYFGATTPAADGWFISTAEFIKRAQNRPVYVLIAKKKLQQFKQAMLPLQFCELMSSGPSILLANSKSCSLHTL